MAITVDAPDGSTWRVRRALLRGKDGQGRRVRWRGPDADLWDLIQIGELAEIPIIGGPIAVITIVIGVALAAIFLPFLVIGLLELLIVIVLTTAALLAATLFGRPIIVRAVQEEGRTLAWGVTGWGSSKTVRDQVVRAIEAGLDPGTAVGDEAILIAQRGTVSDGRDQPGASPPPQ